MICKKTFDITVSGIWFEQVFGESLAFRPVFMQSLTFSRKIQKRMCSEANMCQRSNFCPTIAIKKCPYSHHYNINMIKNMSINMIKNMSFSLNYFYSFYAFSPYKAIVK